MNDVIADNPIGTIALFLVLFYSAVSAFEWIAHRWIMHCQGLLVALLNRLGTCDSHIQHHLDVSLSQDIHKGRDVESTVFGLRYTIAIGLFALVFVVPMWYAMGMNKYFGLWVLLVFMTAYVLINQWLWNSIHTSFHNVYVPANTPVLNPMTGEHVTIWGLPPFRPNPAHPVYKYYFKHHAIHHLSKGVSKCNYNIIQLGFDVVAGTNKNIVDNRAHFAKNAPKNKQEEWLSQHQLFDIMVGDDNRIYYKDIGTNDWQPLPVEF
jgi:hypothetical protein